MKKLNKKEQTKNNGCLSNKILIYGKHPLFSILKSKKRKIYEIYVSYKNKQEFFEILKKENITIDNKLIQFVDVEKLNSIFQ